MLYLDFKLLYSFSKGPILKAKAIDLYKKLTEARGESGPMKEFVASDGWLWRFSKRHGIRELSLQGEKLSADKPAAECFIITFQDFVETNGCTLNQIFNCDETGLYYKLLSKKTLASHFEKCADGRKSQKERVTINACSNALGSIKLSLLLIGKAKNPRCFKNVCRDSLPVVYKNQSNAWVNTQIFANCFHRNFVPMVSKRLRELGVEPKAVLLLDNCSAHPNEDELVSSDGKIRAKFLPPNVASLIQPMDQGVLESIKRHYKRKILEKLILQDSEGVPILDFLRGINMLQISNIIAVCWDEISAQTLRLSWRKILPKGADQGSDGDHSIEEAASSCSNEEFTSLFHMMGDDLTQDELSDWLQSDMHDRGYAHLSDDEIVANMTMESPQDSDDSDPDETEVTPLVAHSSVVKMFDGCLKWLQEQEESTSYNVRVIQELREMAAKKRIDAIKQSKISEFFQST